MAKLKRSIRGHTRNLPDPTISGVLNLFSPKQSFQGWQAPTAITSNPLATIKGKKNLRSPMGWINEPNSLKLIQSDSLDWNWIAEIEAKPNAEQAYPRSTLDDAWQQTRQLSVIQHKIIGPLNPDRKAVVLQSFRERHRNS
jgi:hypothetical protein